MRIVILEDNEDRRMAMGRVIADRFPAHIVEYFAASGRMIQHLSNTSLYDVSLVSLDNDLEMIDENGSLVEPGDGLEVARWLAEQPAVCPVIVHTTNTGAGDGMMELFAETGWIRDRVVPYDGEAWIFERWSSMARDLIVRHEPHRTLSWHGVEILRSGQKSRSTLENNLTEILRATSVELCGATKSSEVSVELMRLDSEQRLVGIAGAGFSLLREFVGGTSVAILEVCSEAFGAGPLFVSDEALESVFRNQLRENGVTQIQLDVIQPGRSRQAIIAVMSRNHSTPLSSHQCQFVLHEARSLLELALMTADLRDSQLNRDSEDLIRHHRP